MPDPWSRELRRGDALVAGGGTRFAGCVVDQLGCDIPQLDVLHLRELDQKSKRRVLIEVVARHEQSFGLADEQAGAERLTETSDFALQRVLTIRSSGSVIRAALARSCRRMPRIRGVLTVVEGIGAVACC